MSVVEYEVLNIDFVNNVATIRPKSGGLKELQLLNVYEGISVVDGPRDHFQSGDLSQYTPSNVTGSTMNFDKNEITLYQYISSKERSLIIGDTYELKCSFDLFEAIDKNRFLLKDIEYADLLKKHLLSAIERIDEIVNSTDEDEDEE